MANPIAEIHLDRLVHNYRLIKNRAGKAEVLAVVKADGYGHGAVPISQALERVGVNYFGVFTIGEALELREAGIKGEIIMFERLSSLLYLCSSIHPPFPLILEFYPNKTTSDRTFQPSSNTYTMF